MKTSERGRNLIKSFEGLRLRAYKCPSGVWTIGYGHTRGVKEGMTITAEKAEKYLISDLATAEKAVSGYDRIYHWNQNEFDALVSFTFNCGTGNLKQLTKSGTRTRDQIKRALPLYRKSNGKILRGLECRRAVELKLFTEV